MSEILPVGRVFDVTAETFLDDVVERSATIPVVVDFWAEWCQPCRTLGPILEKLAHEYDGAFLLAKADTAKLGDIAAGFGVRSIPAVFAVRDKKIVDSFVGAQPESMIRAWLARVLPSPAEILSAEALGLEAGDPAAAEARYREALAAAPDFVPAKAGLARLALAGGRIDEAREIVEALARRGYLEPEVESIQAELALKSSGASAGDIPRLREDLAAAPGDLPRQLALAEALAAAGETTEALDLALDLVERDRRNTGESARKLMISLFHLLPADSEIVTDYRRRLSFAL
ncbi:tetratricopeptide repeat protein [Tundrisphaera sp. TA3]|uniref:tetratricopeptide repeat protein n=1 Tax=Tundrisphaera sp. TA3 TaxID=3435775 RepID=UPI003EBDCEF0